MSIFKITMSIIIEIICIMVIITAIYSLIGACNSKYYSSVTLLKSARDHVC